MLGHGSFARRGARYGLAFDASCVRRTLRRLSLVASATPAAAAAPTAAAAAIGFAPIDALAARFAVRQSALFARRAIFRMRGLRPAIATRLARSAR